MKKINKDLNRVIFSAWEDTLQEFSLSGLAGKLYNLDFLKIEMFPNKSLRRFGEKIIISTKRDIARVLPLFSKNSNLSFSVYLIDDEMEVSVEDCIYSNFYELDIGKNALDVLSSRYIFFSFYRIEKNVLLKSISEPIFSSIIKNNESNIHEALLNYCYNCDFSDYPTVNPFENTSIIERADYIVYCPYETLFLEKLEENISHRPFANFPFVVFSQYGMKTFFKNIGIFVDEDKMPIDLLDSIFVDHCSIRLNSLYHGHEENYASEYPLCFYFKDDRVFSLNSLYSSVYFFAESFLDKNFSLKKGNLSSDFYPVLQYFLEKVKSYEHLSKSDS